MSRLAQTVVILLLMTLLAGNVGAAVRIIVHTNVPTEELENETIERIYLGKLTRWPDDVKIIPVMLKEGDTHETFIVEVLESTTSRFMTFWRQAVFTGRGIPPKSFSSEKELLEYVANTPGAIGYVSHRIVLDGVKHIPLK